MKYTKRILFFILSVFICLGGNINTVHAALSCENGSTQINVNGTPKCSTPITPAVSTGSNCPSGQTPQYGDKNSVNNGMVVGCLSDATFTPDPTPPPAPTTQSGCYSTSSDGGFGGGYIQQPDPTITTNNGCPAGTSLLGSNGVSGTFVNGNLRYTPLEPFPGEKPNPNFCELIDLLFKILIYLGGMVAVLALVIGGITYMFSEVAHKKSGAKTRIQAAIYGLLLLIGSWLILNTVNPQLLNACNILAPANSTAILNNLPTGSGDPPKQVSAPSVQPPMSTGQLINPIQYNDDEEGTQTIQKAEADFARECRSARGVVVPTRGNAPKTTALICLGSNI